MTAADPLTSDTAASHRPGQSHRAVSWLRRTLTQSRFEARTILRNGEQLLVTIALPLVVLVGLTRATAITLSTNGASRVDLVAPGTLALAVMATAFTSQAIAVAFDRRNGVLRLLATTPLGRSGLLAGKVLGILGVQIVQMVLVSAVALALGWQPALSALPAVIVAWLLGTAAFTALALLLAGTLRAEGVLAVANLLLLTLVTVGGVVIPPADLPGWLSPIASFLPSGALGEAMRSALEHGSTAWADLAVLGGWTIVLGGGVTRTFRWQ